MIGTIGNVDSFYVQSAARHADKNMDGVLDFKEFMFLCGRHPVVVFPVFRLQVGYGAPPLDSFVALVA